MVWIQAFVLFLIGCLGLHVPKAFTSLYLLGALVLLLPRCSFLHVAEPLEQSLRRWRLVVFLLILFSVTYSGSMLFWGFWSWSADRLDVINSLVLPALLFLAGLQVAALGRTWSTRMVLAYTFGSLAYTLVALILAREPWWSWWQIFPDVIQLPWGASPVMNVRSVEQNAFPALLLLPSSVLLLSRHRSVGRGLLGSVFAGVSLLGAHVVWSLNGRLGWLALLCAGLPVLGLTVLGVARSARSLPSKLSPILAVVLGMFFVFVGFFRQIPGPSHNIWGQGFCDERLSMFGSILSRLHEAPWGGRLLQVPYVDCYGIPLLFAAHNAPNPVAYTSAGRLSMAHNVFLDIYFNAGFIPCLLLLAAVLPPLVLTLRAFAISWRYWDWQDSLRWSAFCLLMCQWLFQPLMYSDSLLYYLSFFVLGLLCFESNAVRRAFACNGHVVTEPSESRA
jgi:hypothetical protein